jgi:hypothetical protein
MLNSRTLFPALFKSAGGGGGGSGQTIQVTDLPEAVLAEKDKIYQYIGSTTATLTNGYFYKCVEHTTTEGGVITVTYEWENIPVMEVGSSGGGGFTIPANGEAKIGNFGGTDIYACCLSNPLNGSYTQASWISALNVKNVYGVLAGYYDMSGSAGKPIENILRSVEYNSNGFLIDTTSSTLVLHDVVIMYSKN